MNKIVSIKKTSAIFLSIVLVTGTIALSIPSFMIGVAQALPSYGQDNNYDKKSEKKDVSIKNVKCNNINVNLNGLNLNLTSVPFLSNLLASGAQASDEGERGASSYGSGQSGYDNKSFKFVCVNNNNNTVVGGVEEPTPIPSTTTLTVIKQITCEGETEGDCEDLLELINEEDFTFQVEGNNPDPSTPFPGSPTGTVVTLGPGDFNVTEIISNEQDEDIFTFFQTHPDVSSVGRASSFSGDCTFADIFFNNGDTFILANGTITAGESQICIATNAYEIFGSFNSNPIIAQGTEDSSPASELTAMEKTTKLKQHWLELLP